MLLGDSSDAYQRFEEQVELADRAFRQFRDMQTEHGMDAKEFVSAKQTLRERLKALEEELNRYLAGEYGVKVERDKTRLRQVGEVTPAVSLVRGVLRHRQQRRIRRHHR